jgi:2-keto-3-deoxy-L-rhamnonate aldolase RhmA
MASIYRDCRVYDTGYIGSSVVPLVRVGANDIAEIKRALDIVAYGVVVPLVNSREAVRKAVAYTRYPPNGVRGAGPRRAALYETQADEYFDWANKEILTIVQIETEEAVRNVDDIITVDGVDAFFVGPNDLSTSLAVRGELNHTKFIQALEKVLDSGKRHGVPAGTMAFNLSQARDAIAKGIKFVSLSADFRILIPYSHARRKRNAGPSTACSWLNGFRGAEGV